MERGEGELTVLLLNMIFYYIFRLLLRQMKQKKEIERERSGQKEDAKKLLTKNMLFPSNGTSVGSHACYLLLRHFG